MLETILCTTNFSDSSRHALQWAITEARQQHAHITILFTYRLIKPKNGEIIQIKKKMEKEAMLKFSKLEKEILLNKNISYDFRMEVGFINDRVELFIKKTPIKFLVMDKETSAINKESFEALVAYIKVPLVIVP
jgi:hypothetical protein